MAKKRTEKIEIVEAINHSVNEINKIWSLLARTA